MIDLKDKKELSFKVESDHPCLAGHFPGNPIVPAVVILDELDALLKKHFSIKSAKVLGGVKFLQPLLAEQEVRIIINISDKDLSAKVKFKLESNNILIAKGDLSCNVRSSNEWL